MPEQTEVTQMDTEAGAEAATSQSHSRHKKGHMTNIYLTDSDEEAMVDFMKDHEEGMSIGEVLPTVIICLSKCARPGLICKGQIRASSCNQNMVTPQKK